MATLWLDFKQNTKPVKRWSLSTPGILRPQTAHPSASPFDPSGHPAVNERSDTKPTLKSPLHQKGSFYTFYIYEGCFFFRRRLPCDKSYSLCYIDLSSVQDRLRLSKSRTEHVLTIQPEFFLTVITKQCFQMSIIGLHRTKSTKN